MATINVSSTINQITVDSTTNTVTVTETPVAVTVNAASYSPIDSVNGKTGVVNLTTTDIGEGTNQYFTTTRARASFSAGNGISINANGVITNTGAFYNDNLARAALSVVDAGGDGALTYNNTTGVFTYTGPSPSEVRANFSAGTGISLINGQITNTAPYSDTQVRQALSAGTGVTYNSSTGQFSIGQAVGTTSDVTFNDVTVSGDLNVLGTLTTVNTADLTINDNKITLNAGETGTPNLDASLIVERGTSADVSLKWNESLDRWQQTRDGTNYVDIPVSTSELSEGTNQYFTNSRARSAISVSDAGGDGSLAYDSNTGILTYTGPSATEVRAHFSGSTNITLTNGQITLDNDLQGMLSVAGTNNLDLIGNELLFKTRTAGQDDPSLTVYSQGYTDDGYMTGAFAASTPISIVSGGSVSSSNKLRYFTFAGSIVAGTNTVTVTQVKDELGNNIADLTGMESQFIGQDIFDDSFANNSGNNLAYLTYPKGTTITAMTVGSPTNTATFTVSNNALRNFTFNGTSTAFGGTGLMITGWIARNAANTVRLLLSCIDINGNPTTSVQGVRVLKESVTGVNGYRSFDYLQPTVFTADFATTPVIRYLPRKRTELRGPNYSLGRYNEIINVPRTFGVGPNASSTAHGAPDEGQDIIGMALSNDGSITGNTQRLALNITQFKDNSYFSGFNVQDKHFTERAGPYLQFNQFTGNAASTLLQNRFAAAGDGLGHVAFYAQVNSTNYSSLSRNPASINVRATEDMNTGSKQGTGMYFQTTPNNIGTGAPRTFLLNENGQTEVRGLSRVQLKPCTRAVTIATNSGSFDTSTLRLTLNYTTAQTNVPYALGQLVQLSGFSSPYNNTQWNVVSATTSSVVLETSNTNITSSTSAPTTYGNITTPANGRASLNPGQPHVWLEASDYTHNGSQASEGTGTLVKIAAENNNGDVGLRLRRTVGNTANWELKLPTGSADTLQLVNNSNSTTPVTVDNSKVAFAIPVQFPVYTKAQAAAITGAVGQQICISDSASGGNPNGMMAFWDTTNSRWSYIHDNGAL